ncbi:MAG: lysine--tRNA ligase [Candidatus Micrarchaeota archaeon]
MDGQRKAELEALLADGVEPYPYSYQRSHGAKDVVADFGALEGRTSSVAGRIIMKRSFGKLVFVHIQDSSGRLQVFAKEDGIGADKLAEFDKLQLGDFIGVKGKVAKTKKGEISVEAAEFTLLAKALRPMPEKFHGLGDTETRYRKRYLDLIANPEVASIFRKRALIVRTVREYLDGEGFLEVETPVLQQLYGGAAARPFVTRHNALKTDLYLRIADELYLKRLIVGGLERVYELSKDFRNEDIDSAHNPEFTMLEFYEAYADYEGMMRRAEDIFSKVCQAINGGSEAPFKGRHVSFKPPFARVSLVNAIADKAGVDVLSWKDDADALAAAGRLGLKVSKPTRAHVVDALFDAHVKPGIWDPTFVTDYPEFMCPLTKRKRGDERLAERFELYVAGEECANAYSELTNPLEQRLKFEQQAEERRRGDEEAQPFDEDFLEAMEYGMPPTGGIGIGIDRITMIFTGQESIKEVILFPSMRPLAGKKKAEKQSETPEVRRKGAKASGKSS